MDSHHQHTQPLAELSPNKTSPTKSHSHAHATTTSSTTTATTTSSNTTTTTTTNNIPTAHQPRMLKDENAKQNDEAKQTYISPSDNIMSPTTKKLSQIKARRFGTATATTTTLTTMTTTTSKKKSQSLFAKTVGKQQALRSEEKEKEKEKNEGRVVGADAGVGAAVGEEEFGR